MIKELTTLINLKTTYNNMLHCDENNNFYLTIISLIIVYLICLHTKSLKNVKDASGLLDFLETTVLLQQVYS